MKTPRTPRPRRDTLTELAAILWETAPAADRGGFPAAFRELPRWLADDLRAAVLCSLRGHAEPRAPIGDA